MKRAAEFGYNLNIDWREMKLTNTEALAVGVKAGLRLERTMAVMKATMAFNHPRYVVLPKKVFQGDDSLGFAVKLVGKVLRLAVDLAKVYGFDAPVSRAAQESLDGAELLGHAGRDTAALTL